MPTFEWLELLVSSLGAGDFDAVADPPKPLIGHRRNAVEPPRGRPDGRSSDPAGRLYTLCLATGLGPGQGGGRPGRTS